MWVKRVEGKRSPWWIVAPSEELRFRCGVSKLAIVRSSFEGQFKDD